MKHMHVYTQSHLCRFETCVHFYLLIEILMQCESKVSVMHVGVEQGFCGESGCGQVCVCVQVCV